MMLSLLTSLLGEDESIKNINETFMAIDVDDSGAIEKDELLEVYKNSSFLNNYSEEKRKEKLAEIENIVNKLD